MKIKIALFTFTVITSLIYGQTGSITNINTAQRTDGSMMVDIYYDLAGPNPQYVISVEASFNSGTNFAMISQVTGDAGAGVTPGAGKHIVWNFGTEFPGSYSITTKIRIRAYLNDCFYITDTRDGQEYSTVQIGTQCWMAENLNYDSGISRCYEDQPANCDVYGRLYTWSAALAICPLGWHLPSAEEWNTLVQQLGGSEIAGGKLKTTGTLLFGTGLWSDPNTGATNESGFSALPAGYYIEWTSSPHYNGINTISDFWTSTEYIYPDAYRFNLVYNSAQIFSSHGAEILDAVSVRCIKD